MKSRSLKRLALLVALTLAPLAAAPPAFATASPERAAQLTSDSGSSPQTSAALTPHRLAELGRTLHNGSAPRDSVATAYGQRVTYHVSPGVNISFTYDSSGSPVVVPAAHHAIDTSLVSVGSYPFPYISLDSAEQATGATAAAGGLAATICAALGPETGGVGCIAAGGIGVTIVAIVAAHGVCPDNQNYRIYILSLEGQCRND
ncbi:hypothetical protein [Clavibacter michiganensis]|uniref:hypothetical protein n=1 Tax=Clavibacter michiganensis TaxID=28447 RepID=UPI00345BDF9F